MSPRNWVFAALMLALAALFAGLGFWQLERLGEKEAMIATVAERLGDAPQPLPPATEWAALDASLYDYLPVSVSGRFLTDSTVLVFTSLNPARGQYSGPGYWVMTPFAVDGGTVFVNRGFVPQQSAADRTALEAMNPAAGELTLTGVGRRAEGASSFTPAPDAANTIDWVRDPARLAALAGIGGAIAPIYIDLPAGPPGDLPQGGETVVEFPNNHLGYAMTWFGFALMTPILLFFWLRRQRAPAKP
jgi:surfeit locus 1 family protein